MSLKAVDNEFVTEKISISKFGLSASNCLFKIIDGYEQLRQVELDEEK